MSKLITASLLSLVLVAGCKKAPKCEEVYDHTMSLLPDEMKAKASGSKDDAIAKCEKASPEAQQCALDAKSLEDLMKCPRQ